MIGAAVLTICIPLAGYLSDKMSRAKLYGAAAIISSVSVFPAFWMMKESGGNIYLVWIAIIVPYGVFYSVVYGNVAAFLCDLFDAKVRYTGISFCVPNDKRCCRYDRFDCNSARQDWRR
jgi:MFS family permease